MGRGDDQKLGQNLEYRCRKVEARGKLQSAGEQHMISEMRVSLDVPQRFIMLNLCSSTLSAGVIGARSSDLWLTGLGKWHSLPQRPDPWSVPCPDCRQCLSGEKEIKHGRIQM
jgi:hypothetical protein